MSASSEEFREDDIYDLASWWYTGTFTCQHCDRIFRHQAMQCLAKKMKIGTFTSWLKRLSELDGGFRKMQRTRSTAI